MADRQETLFVGGRFIDPSCSCEPLGDALLARNGKIAFLGREAEARRQAAPQSQCVRLEGRTAVPGWVDAHVHLWPMGKLRGQCNLAGTKNRQEALERIAAFAAAHSDVAWIQGRGYNLNEWPDPSYPTAKHLDEAVSDRPCLFKSYDGHSVWANSAALAAAGLTNSSPDPPGGLILRDAGGNPTGCVLEKAIDLLFEAVGPETDAEKEQAIGLAVEELVQLGFTGVHVPAALNDLSPAETRMSLEKLYPDNSCPLRVRIFGRFKSLQEVIQEAAKQRQTDRVQVKGIKLFCDGTLGSRTAWMFQPFCGEGDNCGVPVIEVRELRRTIKTSNEAGLAVICHAVGDRACYETLTAFQDAGERTIPNRVEHAQILRREDVELFGASGAAASVQPGHLWTDWRPSEKLLGPARCKGSFALRSLLDAGVAVAMGSDGPVVSAEPRHSLHAAVTRTDAEGLPGGGWHPEQCISAAEWAAAASHGAWQSIGEGERRGKLQVGMDCDLTIVREDFLAAGLTDYLALHVDGTVVGGRVAHCAWQPGSKA